MIHGWVTTDGYDFLYLVALGVLWFVVRTALARNRSGIPWQHEEILPYSFFVVGAVILVVAALLDSVSGARLPIFIVGLGCMLWGFLKLSRIV